MRENRTSGSEGGEAQTNELSLPLSLDFTGRDSTGRQSVGAGSIPRSLACGNRVNQSPWRKPRGAGN